MCTYYLLPRRAEVGRRFADYLQVWFPGVRLPQARLAGQLAGTVADCAESVVVFADELAGQEGAELLSVLRDGFGAEPNDHVIDLRDGPAKSEAGDAWIISFPSRSPLRKVC
jgi:hypothetical protein